MATGSVPSAERDEPTDTQIPTGEGNSLVDADTVVGTELRGLRRRRPEVAGTVLAGTDGLLISSDLPSTDATHLAALAAASFGLGHRVADTVRRGEFRESVVCTTAGCVVTYPAGRTALLTLVTVSAAGGPGGRCTRRLGRWPDGPARCWTTRVVVVGATAVPNGHAPLAVRTPMATLPAAVAPLGPTDLASPADLIVGARRTVTGRRRPASAAVGPGRSRSTARPASSRATGTRNGEQDT